MKIADCIYWKETNQVLELCHIGKNSKNRIIFTFQNKLKHLSRIKIEKYTLNKNDFIFLGKMLHNDIKKIDFFSKKNISLSEVIAWDYNHKSQPKIRKPSKLTNKSFSEILLGGGGINND